MNWQPMVEFGVYAALGLVSFILWWLIYEWVLTREHSIREAIFGHNPNPAVALDIFGGFLAMGILNHSVISGPTLASFWLDLEATALTLLGTMVLLALLRWLIGEFLRLWFGQQRDSHGHLITINNELFRQRNLATGLFSTGLYLILVAGLLEEDLLNITGNRMAASFNMLGVWLLGLLTVLLHSWLYLGLGSKQHILHESFHENNPSAPLSLLGLLGGVIILNHQLLADLPDQAHMFNQIEHWYFLVLGMVSVFVLRAVLHLLLWGLLRVSIRHELLVKRNHAWGILDGGLIFSLFLILIALIA
ncbi:MAG: DUF350 domain-containing protein [Dehalococcoidia bacterium]